MHSLEIRVLENPGNAVVIGDFYLEMNARRHDFGGAGGLEIDSVARLFPRFDAASCGLGFDFVSGRDETAAELFGILSKTDFDRLS